MNSAASVLVAVRIGRADRKSQESEHTCGRPEKSNGSASSAFTRWRAAARLRAT